GHRGRGTPIAARWTAPVSLVILLLATGWLVHGFVTGTIGVLLVAGTAVLLVGLGATIGVTWREPLGTALAIGGAALGVLALWLACDHFGWPEWVRWCGAAAQVFMLIFLLGLTSGLGRGGLTGGGTGLVLTAVWCGGAVFGLPH